MENQIIRKIGEELDRGITTESQVVYLLVEIRKLLDTDRKKTQPYNALRFYGDWVVHIKLRGPQAQEIVKLANASYPKMMNGTLTQEEKVELSNKFVFDGFRKELNQFLDDTLKRQLSENEWQVFLSCFLNVIEDCPLVCTSAEANLTEVDEVVIIRASERRPDGSAPPIVWLPFFRGELKPPMGANYTISDELVKLLMEYSERRKKELNASPAPSLNP